MQFIDDVIAQRQTEPSVVTPGEIGLCYLGGAKDAIALKPRGRVGALNGVIEAIAVSRTGLDAFDVCLIIAALQLRHWHHTLGWRKQMNMHFLSFWRPNEE